MGDMLGHLWWWWCSLEVTDRCLPILHRVRGLQPDSLPCSHTASAHLQWVGPVVCLQRELWRRDTLSDAFGIRVHLHGGVRSL